MPAVLDDRLCSACGGKHTLCHPHTDILHALMEYEYECPTAARLVRLPPRNLWNRVECGCPLGAVTLRDAN